MDQNIFKFFVEAHTFKNRLSAFTNNLKSVSCIYCLVFSDNSSCLIKVEIAKLLVGS